MDMWPYICHNVTNILFYFYDNTGHPRRLACLFGYYAASDCTIRFYSYKKINPDNYLCCLLRAFFLPMLLLCILEEIASVILQNV